MLSRRQQFSPYSTLGLGAYPRDSTGSRPGITDLCIALKFSQSYVVSRPHRVLGRTQIYPGVASVSLRMPPRSGEHGTWYQICLWLIHHCYGAEVFTLCSVPFSQPFFLVMIGCGQTGTSPDSDQQTAAATFHHKTGGSRPAVGRVFNRNLVVTDAFFNDYEALDVSAVQRFLSESPYGRSWLASATTGSRSVAQTIVSLSREYGINPILMLSRMQVEASLVSPSDRPSQRRIDYAMGCGCADGTQCAYAPVGLEAQLRCAADRFRGLYDLSANGTGWWKKGLPKQTLDTIEVIPESHATAALYAYTPWVLQGQGGTWLAWHIVERFDRHIRANASDFTAATQPNDTDVGTNLHRAGWRFVLVRIIRLGLLF